LLCLIHSDELEYRAGKIQQRTFALLREQIRRPKEFH
jgi:hypothetical protein